MKEVKGLEGVNARGAWWSETHEVHGGTVEGPFVTGDRFIVRFSFDVTPKMTGERTTLDEAALSETNGGRIVKATFMY